MIPKIIHYCWFGPNKISKLELACIKSWKKYLPDFEFMLWNESNFPINEFPFAEEAYKAGKFAFVSDIARLYAIYHHGGIYLDTDMLVLKNFNSLLNHEFFTAYYKEDKIAVGIFGATKKNEIIKSLLRGYDQVQFNVEKLYIITDHFDEYINLEKNNKEIYIYEPSVFYSLPYEFKNDNYKKYITKDSLCVHLWNHSWKNEFSSMKYFFFIESLLQHFKNLLSFKKQYWNFDYMKKYYTHLYRYGKKYLYIKLKSSEVQL